MGAFKRSKDLTKSSFRVIKKDPELFVYVILSSIISFVILLFFLLPIIFSEIYSAFSGSLFAEVDSLTVYFALYLCLFLVSTFFNFAIVYTAAKRFSGHNAKFFESLKFAFSKFHLIFLWSLVSATVGIILKVLENVGKKGGAGAIVSQISRFIIGLAWSISTIFVIPIMVYKGLGPIDSIKKSVKTLKKTWGEYLIKGFGFTLALFAFLFIGLAIGIPLAVIGFMINNVLGGIFVLLIVAYCVILFMTFGLMNQVFNTALYIYAETGHVPKEFSESLLKNSFRQNRHSTIKSRFT